jgi:hypothetical protein
LTVGFVELKRLVQDPIREKIEGKSRAEQVAYWQE